MLFPIWDDQVEGGYRPFWNRIFIVVNVLVFLYEVSLGNNLDSFIMQRGTIPVDIFSGKWRSTLVTAMFLHGWWMHLIGNMLFLFVFWDNIEARIGPMRYVLFYIWGGIVAWLIHAGFNPSSEIPAVGASGAIAAVLGAYLMLFPWSRIKMLFLRTMQTFMMPAKYFLLYRIVTQLFSGVGALASSGLEWGVAWWAHIGGFAFWVAMVMTKILHR